MTFLKVPLVKTLTTTHTSTVCLRVTFPIFHVTVVMPSTVVFLPPSDADTNIIPDGRISVMFTLVASDGPLLYIVIVKFTS